MTLEELKTIYINKKSTLDVMNNNRDSIISKLNEAKKEHDLNTKASLLIRNVSIEVKRNVVTIIEDMVTSALRTIADERYSFKIIIEETAKGNKCEFYISEIVNGEESLQTPQDSCGGGFVDIISTTLRYVYLNVFNSPTLNGPIILDEPAKMLSKDMSSTFADFVKSLGQEFDRQTILITHDDNIAMCANNTINIIK